jgi:hypothetical protein
MNEVIKKSFPLSCYQASSKNTPKQDEGGGGKFPGRKFTLVTKLFNLPPKMSVFTIWDVLNISFLDPQGFRWTLVVWENCVPLVLISQIKYFSTYAAPL